MGKEEVNPNLGLVCKPLPRGGPHIVMQKSKPGIFYDVSGNIVNDELAAAAGFDVPALKRAAALDAAKAEALASVEAKFRQEAAQIDQMSDEQLGVAPAPADTAPFVSKNAAGEPRAVRLVEGGPVRVMEYDNSDKGWKVFDRDTGEVFGRQLGKTEATELLVEAE